MPSVVLFVAVDLLAIVALSCGVYYRRHRRRDLVLAYVALNVGVLSVATVLSGVSIGLGVGLGLFGVLSIIRLRSSELTQEEVAYYFSSLAIGLICGLAPTPLWLAPALAFLIVATMFVVDHPRVQEATRHQIVTLDAVYLHEAALVKRLEQVLGARVLQTVVQQTDLVRDLTVVDVRYRPGVTSAVEPALLLDAPAMDSVSARAQWSR